MNKIAHDKKEGFLRQKNKKEKKRKKSSLFFWIENSLSFNSGIRKGQYIIRDSTLNKMRVLSGHINLVKIWASK